MAFLYVLLAACLVQFQSADATDPWAKDIEEICGLRIDKELYGTCMEMDKKVEIMYYKEHIDAARACKDIKDYRCFEACHMNKLGLTDKTGLIDLVKFTAHIDKIFADHNKDYVKRINDGANHCHMINGKPATLSLTDCASNQPAIECALKNFYGICRPGEKVPAVPTEMKKH